MNKSRMSPMEMFQLHPINFTGAARVQGAQFPGADSASQTEEPEDRKDSACKHLQTAFCTLTQVSSL